MSNQVQNPKSQIIIISLFLIFYGLSFAPIAQANWLSDIGISGGNLIPDIDHTPNDNIKGGCKTAGDCDLTDFIIVAVNLFRLMLGVLGSLALLFFIYGGILFLLSRGNAEMIQRGKSILTQSLIGIMIVLGSWLIVSIVIAALTGQELGKSIKLFGQEWWRLKN